MSRLAEIRDAIGHPFGASRYEGCEFYVSTGRTQYDQGIDKQNFIIVGTVGEQSEESEDKLDELLDAQGALSVKRVVEANRSPHRDVIDVRVVGTSGFRLYANNGEKPRVGAEWTVECLLEGD